MTDEDWAMFWACIAGVLAGIVLTVGASHLFSFEHKVGELDSVCFTVTEETHEAAPTATATQGISGRTETTHCLTYSDLVALRHLQQAEKGPR